MTTRPSTPVTTRGRVASLIFGSSAVELVENGVINMVTHEGIYDRQIQVEGVWGQLDATLEP